MRGSYRMNRPNTGRKKGARPQSAKTGIINLSDLMRIQREIIPSINEEKNRRLYDQKLKENSNAHILKFKGDGLRVDKNSLGYYQDNSLKMKKRQLMIGQKSYYFKIKMI